MTLRRVLVSLVLLSLALAPALGFAGDDLSGAPLGKQQQTRLHHQPHRTWRSVPATLTPAAPAPGVSPVARLIAVEPASAPPSLVRVPFVPPRG